AHQPRRYADRTRGASRPRQAGLLPDRGRPMKPMALLVPEIATNEQAVSWGFLRRVIVHLAYVAQDAPGDRLDPNCPYCGYALEVIRETEAHERKEAL